MNSHYEKFRKSVYAGKTKYKDDWTQVAILAGPTMVIEVMVQEAAKEAKVEMDWSFQGGRGFVMADTQDPEKIAQIKESLKMSLPQLLVC